MTFTCTECAAPLVLAEDARPGWLVGRCEPCGTRHYVLPEVATVRVETEAQLPLEFAS